MQLEFNALEVVTLTQNLAHRMATLENDVKAYRDIPNIQLFLLTELAETRALYNKIWAQFGRVT